MDMREVHANIGDYRFKTREEFVKEFGCKWKDIIIGGWNISGDMDCFFGENCSRFNLESYFNENVIYIDGWCITSDMITRHITSDYCTYGNILK